MKKTGMSESFVDKITKSGAGNLAVAYALYKIATPARYTVTLGKESDRSNCNAYYYHL